MYTPASADKSAPCNGGIVPPTSLPTDSNSSCTPPMICSRSMTIQTLELTTMNNCEVQFPPKSFLGTGRFPNTFPHVLSGLTALCWSTLSGRHVPPCRSARWLRNHLSQEARTKWIYSSPPANFRCTAVGRSRQGRLIIKRWALTVEGIAHRCGRRSRVSRSGCTRAQQRDNCLQNRVTRMAIAPKWRSQVSITPVTSLQIKCTRNNIIQPFPTPSSQVRIEAENA